MDTANIRRFTAGTQKSLQCKAIRCLNQQMALHKSIPLDGKSMWRYRTCQILYFCLLTYARSTYRVSIDGDKPVEHDNEGDNKQDIAQVIEPKVETKKVASTEDESTHDNQQPFQNAKQKPLNIDLTLPQSNASATDHGIKSFEESMIARLGFLPAEDGDLEQTPTGETLYIVFSTDCGSFQHWQSYLLFFSAVRIRQPGFITRIASGCTEEEKEEAREFYQTHIEGEILAAVLDVVHCAYHGVLI